MRQVLPTYHPKPMEMERHRLMGLGFFLVRRNWSKDRRWVSDVWQMTTREYRPDLGYAVEVRRRVVIAESNRKPSDRQYHIKGFLTISRY